MRVKVNLSKGSLEYLESIKIGDSLAKTLEWIVFEHKRENTYQAPTEQEEEQQRRDLMFKLETRKKGWR